MYRTRERAASRVPVVSGKDFVQAALAQLASSAQASAKSL